MTLFILFIAGYLAAFVGIFPPGLINMTAAKISLEDGKSRAMGFVSGALVIIGIQAFISVYGARYIDSHHEVDLILREIGLVIFTLASIYFFFLAKKPQLVSQNALVKKTSRSAFLLGLFISAINLFPIPYYVIVSIALASYGLFDFNALEIYVLVLGILLGSLTVFYAYVVVFNRLRSKTNYLIRNMNVIMGSITSVVSLLTLYHVIRYYW
ncbi:MAG: LysE family transporter [Flavobacterium sp.]|jgi:threonine/homoserine/homoserine lactone efflux protein|nr:LysE family transporter [Flavobacterium sp.]